MKAFRIYILSALAFALLASCAKNIEVTGHINNKPALFPDIDGITVPVNIAPIVFTLADSLSHDDLNAVFSNGSQEISVSADDGDIRISKSDWQELLAKGSNIEIRVRQLDNGEWSEYEPVTITVSKDSIDPYIAYRLIEPGYEIWAEMGIYQRCLEDFDEEAVITNKTTSYNCMNCHSFHNRSADKWLFHMRKDHGGTYIIDNGQIEKLNTKTPNTISALVYPSWHPSGRYVAFSTNDTKQMFHTTDRNRIEVFDYKSDVVVYDVENHTILNPSILSREDKFETFPTFSPDGKTLYFCSADSVTIPAEYNKAFYSLCSISFNPDTKEFSDSITTVYKADSCSVSFPRISPDGRFLMFTRHGYGNFSIWHKDADLWMINLQNFGAAPCAALNSDDVDSYHSWSSNGRWVIFSSRRLDGLYTRPYIAYIDSNGETAKPFLLPQADTGYYKRLMKSFNIPEFVNGKIKTSQYDISSKARNDAGIDLK